eukprot:CAMPEP_0202465830 /NCGR_PEP_ID=MMETSP1360-20130828/66847_1 /ASSEMBLY_ACC=CAM_ASM_000848 /TAXON_ID=515479 /ORGANISM="Licmophora paradoxa, Strain CCMP2313" /LENGTH=52 /DNA_ID=CAMNT_0049089743 /DNA_START=17 /DNA_END=172 /DNA_ORIENTATION=+
MKEGFRQALKDYESELETLWWNCFQLKLSRVPQPKMNALRMAVFQKLNVLNE